MTASLEALSRAAGIAIDWHDHLGRAQRVSEGVLRAMLAALGLPCASDAQCTESLAQLAAEDVSQDWPPLLTGEVGVATRLPACALSLERLTVALEAGGECVLAVRSDAEGHPQLDTLTVPGYHRLQVAGREAPLLAMAPARATPVSALVPQRRPYALAVQLYALRRAGDGGIGDFGGLTQFAAAAARQGADAVAISPTHALFAAEPARYAPYSPSSRMFLHALYADPAAALGGDFVRAALSASKLAETFAMLEALPLIDYAAAAAAKWRLLHALWTGAPLSSARAARFTAFCAQGGAALDAHAQYEAERVAALKPLGFETLNERSIGFHRYLQWLADESLAQTQQAARRAGMGIGLIRDLAVGIDPAGSEAHCAPDTLLKGLSIGAPPDPLAPEGQNWCLTTFSPRALRKQGFAPFIRLLRANLRHAGGLRIDHILGLYRLWLAPDGAAAGEGAYLHYPLQDLLRLAALESHRHRAILIGEDLGTVPAGLREALADKGVLGLRVQYFQRDHGFFVEPSRWSAAAVATSSTHDLPPLAGWWKGVDLAWRAKLGLDDAVQTDVAEERREDDRNFLWGAYQHAGVARGDKPPADEGLSVVDAACAFLAKTPAPLVMLPVEDALGLSEAPNLPGTIDTHPNWQRRLPGTADSLLDGDAVRARLKSLL